MRYAVIIGLSILLFTGIGWGVGAYALRTVQPALDDEKMMTLMIPIGVGAGLGLGVGLAAAILTLIDRRSASRQK